MNRKTRDRLALTARRMLAVQLEIDPKAKTSIGFCCGAWCANVYYFPTDKTWNLDATRRLDGYRVERVDDIPF